ncbi:MAG: H+/Cl- antiporter ClcA [Arenicella sp.]|jgi:H+/Cl- antiporter ClcA
MLIKYAPLIITGASFFIAIGLHWVYKTSFILPSFLAAICTSAVSFLCFRLIRAADVHPLTNDSLVPWNAIGFAFGSGFVLAMLVGYLIKQAPTLFTKL